MYIKNKRDSSSVKVCSPFVYSCKLKDLCFEIAYFSYTKPLGIILNRPTHTTKYESKRNKS